jgi:DNA transformation protein and related proteins
MTVSDSFRTFVLDQLGRSTPRIRAKSMFGGVGVYAGELFFALIDDDVLYLKVDDTNRSDFIARGMKPFAPFGEGGEVMQYYRLPEDLLEDPEELKPWVDKAVAVAARRKKGKTSRKRGSPKSRKPAGKKKPVKRR